MAWEPFGWDIDWGNVPAWAGSILTGGSLLLGFYIVLRDRRKAETDQVNEVIIQLGRVTDGKQTPPVYHATAQIDNRSNLAIHNCLFRASPKPLQRILKNPNLAEKYWAQLDNDPSILDSDSAHPDRRQLKSHLAGDRERVSLAKGDASDPPIDLIFYLEPGASSAIQFDVPMPFNCYVFYVTFTDSRSRDWQLNMATMKLRSADRSQFSELYFNIRKWFGLDGYKVP